MLVHRTERVVVKSTWNRVSEMVMRKPGMRHRCETVLRGWCGGNLLEGRRRKPKRWGTESATSKNYRDRRAQCDWPGQSRGFRRRKEKMTTKRDGEKALFMGAGKQP